MKKTFLTLAVALFVTSMSFASSEIVVKTKSVTETEVTEKEEIKKNDDFIRICFETDRETITNNAGVTITTVTYSCYDHPGKLGEGTVYIGG